MGLTRRLKEFAYFEAHRLVGMDIGKEYRRCLYLDRQGNPQAITHDLLVNILEHCKNNVPYYSKLMSGWDDSYRQDPEKYLRKLPILTKDIIQENYDLLKSNDLDQRKWRYTTTGGSTGDPSVFIQDQEYLARANALQWLSNTWAGRKFGQPGIRIWGSIADVTNGTQGLKMNLINFLANDTWFNAYQMSPGKMRSFLEQISKRPPQLITAYVQSIYELACFAEEAGIRVASQKAILTSAGTLFPYMREKIESVFQCKVFNRYGSREAGDIACECEQHSGLHVFPEGCYIEIVDENRRVLPPGEEGNILITSLANFAMPLIRYSIGDRGSLSPDPYCLCGRGGQMLEKVSGRITDMFVTQDNTLIDGGYFAFLLHGRDWVHRFQVVQQDRSFILYRIVRSKTRESAYELDEIIEKTRYVMGTDCRVEFEFVDDIRPTPSGKYLYLKSEVHT